MKMVSFWRLLLPICAVTVLVGCAPAGVATPSGGSSEAKPAAPKILRVAMHNEPAPGLALFDDSGEGSNFTALIFHSGLVWHDPDGVPQPMLAQNLPSLSDGDWKALPDGTMQVTWKLRPNVKWHDGQPFTSQDMLLGMRITKDPEITPRPAPYIASISDFSAPDPQTFVLNWNEISFLADRVLPREIPAVASHIVGQAFEDALRTGNKQAFLNNPYWSDQWIGVGPYKLGERARGSSLEALAFDDYFLGRPKIDRLSIRYYPSVDTQVLAVLAGEIDFVARGSFSTPHVYTLQQQWVPTGAGKVVPYPVGVGAEHFRSATPRRPG